MIISSDWIGITRAILLSKFIIDPGMHYLIASKPGDTTHRVDTAAPTKQG